MISRYRVSLEGVQLDSLDKNLMILDVSYPPERPQFTDNRVAGLDGIDGTEQYFEKGTVTVTFELHIYDIAKRNAACQKVNEWAAKGGVLTVNDRAKQQLRDVRCERYANIQSARNWTDPLTLVFATTYVPYWRSSDKKVLSLTGSSGSGTLAMDGNVGEALVSVTATAKTAITGFEISVGDTLIRLKELSLANNKKLVIDYVRSRYLRIRADGKSVMAKLQPESTDVLAAPCGQGSAVSYRASGNMAVSIEARGMWRW